MSQLKAICGIAIIAFAALGACSGPRLGGMVERSAFSGESRRAIGLTYAKSIRINSPSAVGRMRPSGVVALPSEELAIVDRERGRAGLFSEEGLFICFLEAPGAFRADQAALGPGMAVYLLDSAGGRIFRFESAGRLAGEAYSGTGEGRLVALCFDKLGTAYLSDEESDEIIVFDSAYASPARWGGFGAGEGMFADPAGLAVDERNRLYVCDSGNSRVQVLDQWGAVLAVWRLGADDCRSRPEAIAVDRWGNAFVTDAGCGCLRVIDASGAQSFRLDVGRQGMSFMSEAGGLDVDGDRVLVADWAGGEIQVFDIVYER